MDASSQSKSTGAKRRTSSADSTSPPATSRHRRELVRPCDYYSLTTRYLRRELYKMNKVRLLYDRDQPTARMCCRSLDEVRSSPQLLSRLQPTHCYRVIQVENPLNMTHCHLRAMSPIHIKSARLSRSDAEIQADSARSPFRYLGNMGVRSSMSVSITAFGDLWGLVSLVRPVVNFRRPPAPLNVPTRQTAYLRPLRTARLVPRAPALQTTRRLDFAQHRAPLVREAPPLAQAHKHGPDVFQPVRLHRRQGRGPLDPVRCRFWCIVDRRGGEGALVVYCGLAKAAD